MSGAQGLGFCKGLGGEGGFTKLPEAREFKPFLAQSPFEVRFARSSGPRLHFVPQPFSASDFGAVRVLTSLWVGL